MKRGENSQFAEPRGLRRGRGLTAPRGVMRFAKSRASAARLAMAKFVDLLKSAPGLSVTKMMGRYLIVHGRARPVEGGAAKLFQDLAEVYVGSGVKFPHGRPASRSRDPRHLERIGSRAVGELDRDDQTIVRVVVR